MAKKCRECGKPNPRPLYPHCSWQCDLIYQTSPKGIAAHEKRKAASIKKAEARERRRQVEAKEGLMRLADWKKKIQTEFNKYIRLRDKDKPCISCGRHHQGQYHAGHYRSVGACPELRYDERNCFKQCAPCNNHLSGNLIEYRINLVKKYGQSAVDFLEGKHEPLNLTIPEAKDLLAYWKHKVKEIKSRDCGD